MNKRDYVIWHARPRLRHPYMLAGWSGMGAVALLAANYLRQELDARLLAEIDPYGFFSPSQVIIDDGLIRDPEFPDHKFYYWDKGEVHDLVIMIGTEQPTDTYGMAREVLDVAQRLGVERLYTGAAMATFMHHAQDARVWGTATHPDLLPELKAHGALIMKEGTISGLNGLVLALARERGIRGACLLGEIPVYATQVISPKAARAVLAVLGSMWGIEIDLSKLTAWVDNLAPQLDQLYGILPEHARQAIERHIESDTGPVAASSSADEPLIANDAFFAEIERFLKEHGDEDAEEKDTQE